MFTDGDCIDVFRLIAERKITEAMERGEFDNLPGKGKPLVFHDDPLEPPERRLANKILKNAGIAPVEISLRRELTHLKREYARAKRADERQRLMKEIRWMVLRLNLLQKSAL
ncbi:MAG: DUF1992 domain-containing protein [Acidobacteriota bacterium]|nr:DUF1992 domain-containing protein [Blastocatellia bacterium]MDW8240140.1 DUF1992 domain-containing protein [Acidobacteriota bacterium]